MSLLVGIMNIMKINQYQIHQEMYGCRVWFNGLNQYMFP